MNLNSSKQNKFELNEQHNFILSNSKNNTKSMSNKLSGKLLIHITQFFNQNFFIFKAIENNNVKLIELENEINKCAQMWRKNEKCHKNVQPNVGDIIGYYNNDWNKWIRVRVCNVNHSNLEILKYTIWAIDHGRMIESTSINFAYLPVHVQHAAIQNVFHGSCCEHLPDVFDQVSHT